MNITFIGFGKVSYTLSKLIQSPDINLITSTENRSQDTIDLIKKSNVEVFPSYNEAIEKSDIVISAVTPSRAVEVAEKCRNANGFYANRNIDASYVITTPECIFSDFCDRIWYRKFLFCFSSVFE